LSREVAVFLMTAAEPGSAGTDPINEI